MKRNEQTDTSESTELRVTVSIHENYGLMHGKSYGWEYAFQEDAEKEESSLVSFWSAYGRSRRYDKIPSNS